MSSAHALQRCCLRCLVGVLALLLRCLEGGENRGRFLVPIVPESFSAHLELELLFLDFKVLVSVVVGRALRGLHFHLFDLGVVPDHGVYFFQSREYVNSVCERAGVFFFGQLLLLALGLHGMLEWLFLVCSVFRSVRELLSFVTGRAVRGV